MRVRIDIPEAHAAELGRLAESEGVPLADLVREAISDLLAVRRARNDDAIAAAFGLWGSGEDGLVYQERLRSEWDGRAG